MHKLCVGVIAAFSTAAVSQVAFAADMPTKAPVYKAPVMAGYSWTGFYLGLNAGVGVSGTNSPAASRLATIINLRRTGLPVSKAMSAFSVRTALSATSTIAVTINPSRSDQNRISSPPLAAGWATLGINP